MTATTQEFLLFAMAQAFTAAGVYAAIRADLRELMVRMAIIEKRLDKA